jgi:alpha-1,3-glucan synthase
MMEKYPKRVFSKPEFTALPPFIFTGAEFALIPSRDEPFGLVAVEFGRKGALGVGARVGGLGQMPGWWFTVESTTTKHMLHQFKSAIEEALESKTETRAIMRARSAKQRFPVAKWVEDLNTLQQTAIKIHNERKTVSSKNIFRPRSRAASSQTSLQFPDESFFHPQSRAVSTDRLSSYEERPAEDDAEVQESGGYHTTLRRGLSLGFRAGPGHEPRRNPADEPLIEVREHRSPSRTPDIHEYDPEGAVTSIEGLCTTRRCSSAKSRQRPTTGTLNAGSPRQLSRATPRTVWNGRRRLSTPFPRVLEGVVDLAVHFPMRAMRCWRIRDPELVFSIRAASQCV